MSKLLKVAVLSSVSALTLLINNIQANELPEAVDGVSVAKKSEEHSASIVARV